LGSDGKLNLCNYSQISGKLGNIQAMQVFVAFAVAQLHLIVAA